MSGSIIAVYFVATGFWFLALLAVCARIYSKKVLTNFYGICDTVIIAAFLVGTGDYVLKILWLENGLGQHVQNVSKTELLMFSKVAFARTVVYPWALGLAKISILIFYRRVFPVDNFKTICVGFMVFVTGLTIASSFASAFGCNPLSNGPDLIYNQPGDGCINRLYLQFSANILHLITDVMIWLLPMQHLWHLRLKKQKRIRTIIIFSVGIVPCIASAVRLHTVVQFYKGSDPTYQAVGIAILSATEVNLVIIAASIPASNAFYSRYLIRPLKRRLHRYFPSINPATTAAGTTNFKGYGNFTYCHSGPGTVPPSVFSQAETTLTNWNPTTGPKPDGSPRVENTRRVSIATSVNGRRASKSYPPIQSVVMELEALDMIDDEGEDDEPTGNGSETAPSEASIIADPEKEAEKLH